MCARIWATFSLISVSIPLAAASIPRVEPTQISLRLRTGALPAGTAEEMRKELATLMDSAGFAAHWGDPSRYSDVNGLTVLVDIAGDCSVPYHSEPSALVQDTPLGSTATTDNHVMPFITLNCNTLNALMAPVTSNRPESFRDFAFGRALGRVLAHELYHVVTRSENHPFSGLAKAHLSAEDLMKPSLEFDETALSRLRASARAESSSSTSDNAHGASVYAEPEGK